MQSMNESLLPSNPTEEQKNRRSQRLRAIAFVVAVLMLGAVSTLSGNLDQAPNSYGQVDRQNRVAKQSSRKNIMLKSEIEDVDSNPVVKRCFEKLTKKLNPQDKCFGGENFALSDDARLVTLGTTDGEDDQEENLSRQNLMNVAKDVDCTKPVTMSGYVRYDAEGESESKLIVQFNDRIGISADVSPCQVTTVYKLRPTNVENDKELDKENISPMTKLKLGSDCLPPGHPHCHVDFQCCSKHCLPVHHICEVRHQCHQVRHCVFIHCTTQTVCIPTPFCYFGRKCA